MHRDRSVSRTASLCAWSVAAVLAVCSASAQDQRKPSEVKPVFEKDVQPILQSNCVGCHGPATKMKDLDLSTFSGVMKGSESGAVITPGKPAESALFVNVEQGKMPQGGKRLPADKIAVIREWIDAGAPSTVQASASVHSEPLTEDDVFPDPPSALHAVSWPQATGGRPRPAHPCRRAQGRQVGSRGRPRKPG